MSLVIPVYNEQDNLQYLYERIVKTLDPRKSIFEIIFVNDGSTDGSLDILKDLHGKDARVKIVDLSRNFGHEIATSAGLRYAKGDVVVVMESDLQRPPEFIPVLLSKYEEGFDVVCALRKQRRAESFYKVVVSKLFYRLINRIIEIRLPQDSTEFILLNRKAVDAILRFDENIRFFRGIVSWIGFKSAVVYYEEDSRYKGRSKYDLSGLLKLAVDIITGYSIKPLAFVTYTGFTVFLASFVMILYYFIKTIVSGISFPGYASLMITILMIGGVQLLSIGIIGQYIGRIYTETQRRPLYLVNDLIGINDKDNAR
jgi:glycosyltransferase involved in cell wall biosynthesis